MFLGQLLTLLILLFINSRVLYLHHVKRDSIVMLAPFALILSILLVLAWGINYFNLLIIVLTFLTVIINIRAMLRYSEKLFLDIYSLLMKIGSITLAAVTIVLILFSVIIHPVNLSNKKLNLTVTTEKLEGNFRTGFSKQRAFSKANIILTEISPKDEKLSNHVILFVPDIRGDSSAYMPFLKLLASNDFTVLTADFYTNDCSWFTGIKNTKFCRNFFIQDEYFNFNDDYKKKQNDFIYNYYMETEHLVKTARERYGTDCNFFLIGDSLSGKAVKQFAEKNNTDISGSFNLEAVSDYKSAGFGMVEQTDYITARRLNLKRDKNCTTPNLLVTQTLPEIYNSFLGGTK
ncbi:MAG: hypothetical protein IKX23_07480 [Treponema sp.]|nr:hypothetical protein [Treponema sp.]